MENYLNSTSDENFNAANESVPAYFSESGNEALVANIQRAVFLGLGVFGNILLIIVFIRRIRANRTGYVYNYMIFALAVGDLLVLVVYLPYYMTRFYVTLAEVCRAWNFFGVILLWYIHLMICIAIPVERYIAICRPMVKLEQKQVYIIIVAILASSIPVATPYAILSRSTDVDGTVVGCHFGHETLLKRKIIPGIILCAGACAVVVALTLYTLLFVKLFKIKRKHAQLQKTQQEVQGFNEFIAKFRIACMLFGVTVVYFACWMPYFLAALKITGYDNRYTYFYFFNNATNFIVYGIANKSIRQDMFAVLGCKSAKPKYQSKSWSKSKLSSSRS